VSEIREEIAEIITAIARDSLPGPETIRECAHIAMDVAGTTVEDRHDSELKTYWYRAGAAQVGADLAKLSEVSEVKP